MPRKPPVLGPRLPGTDHGRTLPQARQGSGAARGERHRLVIHAVNPEHALADSSVKNFTGMSCIVTRNPRIRMSNAGRVGSVCTASPCVD